MKKAKKTTRKKAHKEISRRELKHISGGQVMAQHIACKRCGDTKCTCK